MSWTEPIPGKSPWVVGRINSIPRKTGRVMSCIDSNIWQSEIISPNEADSYQNPPIWVTAWLSPQAKYWPSLMGWINSKLLQCELNYSNKADQPTPRWRSGNWPNAPCWGGGERFCPSPCLNRDRVAVARQARWQSRALDEHLLRIKKTYKITCQVKGQNRHFSHHRLLRRD